MSRADKIEAYMQLSQAIGGDEPPNPIEHPEIVTQDVTCWGVPEVHEGTLLDGRYFFFRYRHGTASLGVGWGPDAAIMGGYDAGRAVMKTGDPLQGVFFDDHTRNETFEALLTQIKR